MEKTPKSLRLHIALMGRTNAGKSSFLNLVSGQSVAITSHIAGTTTDVVEKSQELLPLGPITWLDTAGFGDVSVLSPQRLAKTNQVFERADVVALVLDGNLWGEPEDYIVAEAQRRNLPLLKIYNKSDLACLNDQGICVNSLDLASRDMVLNQLKAELLKIVPDDFIHTPALLGDLAPAHSSVIMIVPIDFEAPKGRLIMPQVQAIRDCLNHQQIVTVVKDDDYSAALANFKNPPALVVCDSQVVDKMVQATSKDIKCTTFSILFARLKGDLDVFVRGAAVIPHLENGDKVLIAEACTHHAVEDDIGKVKIPNLLKKKTGKNLDIHFVAGHDFPSNLAEYKLVIHCGGCMFNRREILSRVNNCENVNVPVTNYGVCISELKGVLERVLEAFPSALQTYREIKNG